MFGGYQVELEHRRHMHEDRGAVGAKEGGVWGGGAPPPQKLFAFFISKW